MFWISLKRKKNEKIVENQHHLQISACSGFGHWFSWKHLNLGSYSPNGGLSEIESTHAFWVRNYLPFLVNDTLRVAVLHDWRHSFLHSWLKQQAFQGFHHFDPPLDGPRDVLAMRKVFQGSDGWKGTHELQAKQVPHLNVVFGWNGEAFFDQNRSRNGKQGSL